MAGIDNDRQVALPLDIGHALMSSMFRVESSKEQTPRSQTTTCRFPSDKMYSADMSKSFTWRSCRA